MQRMARTEEHPMTELQQLEDRLTNIVRNTCNTIGCKDCGLKYGGFDASDCAATDLNNRILEIEMSPSPPTDGKEA